MSRLPLAAGLFAVLAAATVFALEGPGFVSAVHAARWTARVMLPFFVVAFVALGRRFDAHRSLRRAACRAAAVTHAVHLLAVASVVALEPPAAHRGVELLTEIGGGSAAAVILAGWWLWNRGWYRWLTYWPWGVFVFTYLFLARLGERAPRIVEAPAVFAPVLALLVGTLLVRAWSDFSGARARGPVAAIVLAAGSSTRMGRNKMLLDMGEETLVRRSVRAALEAGLAPVIVVLGHEADRVREAIAGLPCRPVLNHDHAQGMRVSLQAGLRAVPQDARGAVIILADMPFVTAAMMRKVVERYREGSAPLVVSEYGAVNAPPTLYDRSLFPELLAMTGEGGGKQVALGHQHEAATVAWPEEALADVDVPEDYERIARGSFDS